MSGVDMYVYLKEHNEKCLHHHSDHCSKWSSSCHCFPHCCLV